MKHKLLTFFFLIALGFSFNLITPTDSKAGECHRVNGSIVIDQADEDKETPFSHDNGTSFAEDNCEEEPSFYKLQIYKVLLCTKDPYVPNGVTPILNLCVATLVDRGVGNPLNMIIEPGEEFNMLDGADLLLPINKYTHAAIISSSVVRIKHSEKYVIANGDAYTMNGYNVENGGYSEGHTCWSVKDRATSYTNSDTSLSSDGRNNINKSWVDSEGFTLSVTNPNTDEEETLSLACANTAPATSGNLTHGYSAEILDSLNSRENGTEFCGEGSHDTEQLQCEVTFGNYENYDLVLGATSGEERAFNLLQNDLSLATNKNNATKLLYVISFNNPLNINEQTTGLKISISTTKGVSVDVHQEGSNPVQAKKMGANPFGIFFQTKTKRSRGAWR